MSVQFVRRFGQLHRTPSQISSFSVSKDFPQRKATGLCFWLCSFCCNWFSLVYVNIPVQNSSNVSVNLHISSFFFGNASFTYCRKLSCIFTNALACTAPQNGFFNKTFASALFALQLFCTVLLRYIWAVRSSYTYPEWLYSFTGNSGWFDIALQPISVVLCFYGFQCSCV